MRTISLIVFLILLTGCTESHKISTQQSSNPDVAVDLVLEHDGCKVYRFVDGGRYIYFVKGGIRTEWSQDEGSDENHTEYKRTVEMVE